MAKILENPNGRRLIKLNTDEIFSIIAMYKQRCAPDIENHSQIRDILENECFYLPEDV